MIFLSFKQVHLKLETSVMKSTSETDQFQRITPITKVILHCIQMTMLYHLYQSHLLETKNFFVNKSL